MGIRHYHIEYQQFYRHHLKNEMIFFLKRRKNFRKYTHLVTAQMHAKDALQS
jgi:hypothetical protein